VFAATAAARAGAPQAAASRWLDEPLVNWNTATPAMPQAPASAEGRDALLARCRITPETAAPGAGALAAAGWIPYRHLDRELTQDGIEVLGGFTAADGMCRPDAFNLFVFVNGRFAGTLSPVVMSSRADGAAGAVRILPGDMITAEFARYTSNDPLCCPSSRVTVSFRVSRGSSPTIAPAEIRTTRG
jgi:hypothetical protein